MIIILKNTNPNHLRNIDPYEYRQLNECRSMMIPPDLFAEAPSPVSRVGRSLDDVVSQLDESFLQMLLRLIDEKDLLGKVVFVITTDGMENASCKYSYDRIRQMIEHQKSKYDWEFIFLGANIDAISTAAKFGIHADRAANYHADCRGTALNYSAVSSAVSELRACKSLDKSWQNVNAATASGEQIIYFNAPTKESKENSNSSK